MIQYPPGFEDDDRPAVGLHSTTDAPAARARSGPADKRAPPGSQTQSREPSSGTGTTHTACRRTSASASTAGSLFVTKGSRCGCSTTPPPRAYIAERYGPREVAAFERCRHPAMRSDYLRMCFVLAEGGLYVDADDVLLGDGWSDVFRDGTLKVQPLCYDVICRRHGGGGGTPASRPADGGSHLLRQQQPDRRPRRAPGPAAGAGSRDRHAPGRRSGTGDPVDDRPGTSRRPWPRTRTRR